MTRSDPGERRWNVFILHRVGSGVEEKLLPEGRTDYRLSGRLADRAEKRQSRHFSAAAHAQRAPDDLNGFQPQQSQRVRHRQGAAELQHCQKTSVSCILLLHVTKLETRPLAATALHQHLAIHGQHALSSNFKQRFAVLNFPKEDSLLNFAHGYELMGANHAAESINVDSGAGGDGKGGRTKKHFINFVKAVAPTASVAILAFIYLMFFAFSMAGRSIMRGVNGVAAVLFGCLVNCGFGPAWISSLTGQAAG